MSNDQQPQGQVSQEQRKFSFKEVEYMLSKFICEHSPKHSTIESPGMYVSRHFASPLPASSQTEVQKEEWISVKEYEQKVFQLLSDKPVIEALVRKNIPFKDWHSNIHNLIDKELGAIKEVRVKMPADKINKI